MSRLLIGSSNVYRHYRAMAFNKYTEYSMIRCVDIESFVAQMENLEPSESEVVISVIENFIERASDKKEGDERNKAIFEATKKYMSTVEDAAKKNIGTKFVLVDPILRPKLAWYDSAIDIVKKEIRDMLAAVGLVNISRADVISRASQVFEADGVHLTKEAGTIFLESILEAAERTFTADYVDLESGTDRTGGDPSELLYRVSKLEKETEERRWNDNLIFSRTREELDMLANKTKEDRIIITGLSSKTPPPADRDQKKVWLRKIVIDTIKLVKPDFDGNLGFINQGKSNGKEIPMVEARLNSVEVASGIRKAYAEKRKEGDGNNLGKLYMSNAVTLSTRVRIDILKAIGKKVTNAKDSAYVAAYSSRPILHVRTKTGRGEEVINRAYTFTDAIIKFGRSLVRQDLEEAYKRAGTAFRGQLEQHFIVLREWNPEAPRARPEVVRPGKRTREEHDVGDKPTKSTKK